MTKRLIDVDDAALAAAGVQLGTTTMKDTVNEALRRIAGNRRAELDGAFETLAAVELSDRDAAWR